MHILERNIQAAIRQSLLSGFRLREIQDPKDLVTGSHTIHGNMEKGAQEPERQENSLARSTMQRVPERLKFP